MLRCGRWRWRRRRRCRRHIFVSDVVAFRLWNFQRVYVRDDMACWAQKLHTLTDVPAAQRGCNHPSVAIASGVHTPSKTRGYRFLHLNLCNTRICRSSVWLNHRSVARCTWGPKSCFCLKRRYSWLPCLYTKPRTFWFFLRIRHHVTTTDVLWTGDCQFYLLCEILDIYRSPAYVYWGLELVSVTCA